MDDLRAAQQDRRRLRRDRRRLRRQVRALRVPDDHIRAIDAAFADGCRCDGSDDGGSDDGSVHRCLDTADLRAVALVSRTVRGGIGPKGGEAGQRA
eukprot:gene2192-4705_t